MHRWEQITTPTPTQGRCQRKGVKKGKDYSTGEEYIKTTGTEVEAEITICNP